MKLLITGATGNVGRSIIEANESLSLSIYAGVRNCAKVVNDPFYKNTQIIPFDFENLSSSHIPQDVDVIFLMRPPQITDPLIFSNFLEEIKNKSTHIIFLSIQNADKKEFTPHRKIEHKIIESGFPYTFIRPSYFMDNLITTLYSEIQKNNRIYMPSGNLKFNWIDVADIGSLICKVAHKHQQYDKKSLELTGTDSLNFKEVVLKINELSGSELYYKRPCVLSFVFYSIMQKNKIAYIIILLLLHWLPKFGKETEKTDTFEIVMGRQPRTLEDFVRNHMSYFQKKTLAI